VDAETETIWIVFGLVRLFGWSHAMYTNYLLSIVVRALPNNQRFGIVCLVEAIALLLQVVAVLIIYNRNLSIKQ